MKKERVYDNESGISVIIGTLLLILVVLVGVLAIATIVATTGNGVAKQMNTQQEGAVGAIPLSVYGSDDMNALTTDIAQAYMSVNPSVHVTSGSIAPDGIYSSLISGTSDIGAVSGKISYPDLSNNPNIQTTQVGEGLVVIIVNKTNPITTHASYSALCWTFSNPSNPNAISGAIPITRSDDAGIVDEFYNIFLGEPTLLNVGVPVNGDVAVIQGVSTTPNAIGFANYGDVENAILSSNENVEIIGFDDQIQRYFQNNMTYQNLTVAAKDNYLSTAVHANGQPVWAGNQTMVPQYNMSLFYPLYYVTKQAPNSAESGFIQYAKSPGSLPQFQQAGDFSIAGF